MKCFRYGLFVPKNVKKSEKPVISNVFGDEDDENSDVSWFPNHSFVCLTCSFKSLLFTCH